MILNRFEDTDEKEADLAIFFVPFTGILAKLSSIALELDYLTVVMELLPLCKVISSGPACDSLF